MIHNICRKTSNPSLCQNSLESDPRSAIADLRGLGQISIEIARTSAKETLELLTSLEKQTVDHRLKGIYETCSETYDDAEYSLDIASQALRSGDFMGMNIRGSAALDGAVTCQDSFEDARVSPPERMNKANLQLQALCSTVLVISNLLAGQ